MYVEGEVEHCGISFESSECAVWGKYEDVIFHDVRYIFVAALLPTLHRLFHIVEPLGQDSVPFDPFVGPVGSEPILGDVVHPAGADLHLDNIALGILYSGVERFVAVRFWGTQPVTETFGVGSILLCHNGIYLPAQGVLHLPVFGRIDDDADGKDICHPLESYPLLLHLFPDRVSSLGPAFECV